MLLKESNNTNSVSPEAFQRSDDLVKLYTGLPCWKYSILWFLFRLLYPLSPTLNSTFESVVMFLMNVRLNFIEFYTPKYFLNFHKVLDVVNPRITHGQIEFPLGKLYHPASESLFVKDCVIIYCILLNSLLIFLPQHKCGLILNTTLRSSFNNNPSRNSIITFTLCCGENI